MLDFEQEKETLRDSEFYNLRDYIYNLCGIYFRLEKKYLIEDKILSRMKILNLNSTDDYIYYLKYSQEKDKELNLLYDFITINETSFFRNLPQINAFKEEILPNLIKENPDLQRKHLRFWSAGCSSGEEPYTLSIIIKEALNSCNNRPSAEILATDINPKVLEKAERGIYSDYSLRNTDRTIIEKCFNHLTVKEYQIMDKYKEIVRFKKLNLLDFPQISIFPSFDVIFCRNVLIYFDMNSKKKVLEKFYDLLKPGGYLFLGHSESLHGISAAFKLILFKGALAYKKE